MNKQILLATILCMPLLSGAMEADEIFEPEDWMGRPLGALLAESQSTSFSRRNRITNGLKFAFVQTYLERYQDQQYILGKVLLVETKGVVRATADPELAQKDPNKFYCIDVLEYTANQIDERWARIHHADCKYISASIDKMSSLQKPPCPPTPIQPLK